MTSRPASFAGGIMNPNGSCSSTCTVASMSANKRLCSNDLRKSKETQVIHIKDNENDCAYGSKQLMRSCLKLCAYVLLIRCRVLIIVLMHLLSSTTIQTSCHRLPRHCRLLQAHIVRTLPSSQKARCGCIRSFLIALAGYDVEHRVQHFITASVR